MSVFYNSSTNSLPSASMGSYCDQVRAAHALADMLKRTRPHLHEKVDALQLKVTLCQNTLDQCQQHLKEAKTNAKQEGCTLHPTSHETMQSALRELEDTTQALLDLRHKGQMAK